MAEARPPRNGEGDQPQANGGGRRASVGFAAAPSTTAARRSPSPFRGGLFLAVLVLALDQFSKWWITGPLALPLRDSIEILPVFRLIWVQNHGVSMGLLVADSAAQRWVLAGFTGLIAVVVAVWLVRERKLPEALALGAILGGALGNIADRVRIGYVTDLLNLHFGAWSPFLVFNVADVAISLGVALLVIRSLLPQRGAPALGE